MNLVKEHIDFQRGLDPKQAMDIGQEYLDNKFIKKTEWSLNQDFIRDECEKVHLIRNYHRFPILVLYYKGIHPNKSGRFTAVTLSFLLFQRHLTYWHPTAELALKNTQYFLNDEITESINFQRGLDPKQAMGTGAKAVILQLLKKWVGEVDDENMTVLDVSYNKWEIETTIILHKGNRRSIYKKLISIGLDQFIELPAHNIGYHKIQNGYNTYLFKFKPEFVGLFDMKTTTLYEAMQFQRGLEPKAAMGIGLESILKKYAEDHYDIDPDDFKISYVDILDHLVNEGGDPSTLPKEQKKIFIDWLLPRVDFKYLDENIVEGLKDLEWNLVPLFKKLPDMNFSFTKNGDNYVLKTSDWVNFVDYFQKNSSRNENYEKYIDAVLSGDAYVYFQYDYARDFRDGLDVSDLQYASPSELGDIIKELAKIKFPNKRKQIEIFQKAKRASIIFDFIWEKADENPEFLELKRNIIRAASETIEAGNEHATFQEITKQLTTHFSMTLLKISVDLKFKITEKGLNKFIYAYYLNEEKVRFIEHDTYGKFDMEVFHDCFDNAINN